MNVQQMMYVFVSRHFQSCLRRWLASVLCRSNSSLSVTASRVGLICHKDQLKQKKPRAACLGFNSIYIEVNGKNDVWWWSRRKVWFTVIICSTAGGAVVTHRIDFRKTARLDCISVSKHWKWDYCKIFYFLTFFLVKHCFTCSLIEASTASNSNKQQSISAPAAAAARTSGPHPETVS